MAEAFLDFHDHRVVAGVILIAEDIVDGRIGRERQQQLERAMQFVNLPESQSVWPANVPVRPKKRVRDLVHRRAALPCERLLGLARRC